jgi:hypothetical protein
MTGNRTLYLTFVVSATLFLYAVLHQWGGITAEAIQEKLTSHMCVLPPITVFIVTSLAHSRSSSGDESTFKRPNFEQIARKYGTDKVTTHKYQSMYDKYLSDIRDDQLKVLEIGLGCNMVSIDLTLYQMGTLITYRTMALEHPTTLGSNTLSTSISTLSRTMGSVPKNTRTKLPTHTSSSAIKQMPSSSQSFPPKQLPTVCLMSL